jgi:hypothetical protein
MGHYGTYRGLAQTGGSVLNNGSPVPAGVQYPGANDETVFRLLARRCSVDVFYAKDRMIVTKIDGVGGFQNCGWAYFVNGQMGLESPEFHFTAPTDIIEWRLIEI